MAVIFFRQSIRPAHSGREQKRILVLRKLSAMRVLKEIVTPNYRATIFNWNNKYLIKLETALLEQTFKVSQFDVTGDTEVEKLLNPAFIDKALKRFDEMGRDLHEALEAID
jgi:hypothetical protein